MQTNVVQLNPLSAAFNSIKIACAFWRTQKFFGVECVCARVCVCVCERYKNTFSKVSFNLSYNKNRLETENIFLREESIVKIQKRQQKIQGRRPKLGDGW